MTNSQVLRDKFWHLLCHQAELPDPGNYIKLEWLGQEVVLFNDNGEIVVFDNRCPHRGTRFFVDLHGTGVISCPYHRWSYTQGILHIPCRADYSAEELKNTKLNTFRVEWCGSFLFMAVDPQLSLNEQLGTVFDLLANISFNIDGRSDFNHGVFNCDWQVAIENALEPLHVPYVHADSLGKLGLTAGRNEFANWSSIWYSDVANPRMLKQLSKMKSLFQIDFQYDGYMFIFLFPFTMISSTFGYSYSLQNFFPDKEVNKTIFYSRLLSSITKNQAATEALQGFFASTAQVNRQVFEEDRIICERVAHDFGAGILSSHEEKITHFRQCLKQEMLVCQ